jgi:hypothetical protein
MEHSIPGDKSKQRKVFWIAVAVLGLLANVLLSLGWVLVATIPIVLVAWWVAYQSEWL